MYNSGVESNIVDRGSLRKMAYAQVCGSSYYSQSAKERLPYKNVLQRSHSSRCYTGAPGSGINCSPCVAIPSSQGLSPSHDPMGTWPTFWRGESNAMPPNTYCLENGSDWSYVDHSPWKSYGQTYHVDLNQGMNE